MAKKTYLKNPLSDQCEIDFNEWLAKHQYDGDLDGNIIYDNDSEIRTLANLYREFDLPITILPITMTFGVFVSFFIQTKFIKIDLRFNDVVRRWMSAAYIKPYECHELSYDSIELAMYSAVKNANDHYNKLVKGKESDQRQFLQKFIDHLEPGNIMRTAAQIALDTEREQNMIDDLKSQLQLRPDGASEMLGPELTKQLKKL